MLGAGKGPRVGTEIPPPDTRPWPTMLLPRGVVCVLLSLWCLGEIISALHCPHHPTFKPLKSASYMRRKIFTSHMSLFVCNAQGTPPPLDSETEWTGEFWSKTLFLK